MTKSKPMSGQHLEDGGTISVFIQGSDILFACTGGHWWSVQAGDSGTTKDGRDSQPEMSKAKIKAVADKFGDEPLRFMKMIK